MPNSRSFEDKQLETAIWFVRHKIFLRQVLILTLILIDLIFWGFVVFKVGLDIYQLPERKRIDIDLTRSQDGLYAYTIAHQPQATTVGNVDSLAVGEVTDVVARLANPNTDWYANFNYRVGVGETVEIIRDGFLLPGEERLFFKTFRGARGSLTFELTQIEWRRINKHEINNFVAFREERLNFAVERPTFTPAVVEARGTVSRAHFSITNRGAYGFFEPKFLVTLYRGSQLAAIQSIVLNSFRSGETREVEVSWYDRVGAVSSVEVTPEIDILNPDVYLKPERRSWGK